MKKLPLLTVTFLASALLTSCSSKTGTADPDSLTIMGKKTDLAKSYMTRIFEKYESESGEKLNIISIEDAEYEKKAEEMIDSGDLPDIFLHFNNSDLNRFDVAENFCYLNDEDWYGELTDSALAYCLNKDGDLLGLPFWENSVSGCYYNKTILDSLGLKPATSQAEFDVLCGVLKELGYTPICWAADGCSWMPQFGLDPIFADDPDMLERINTNQITYSEIPEVTGMVKWIKDAADKGWFGADYLSCAWDDISPALASGDAVMTFIWDTWFYTDFETGNKYDLDDFALMPVFMNTVEGGTYEGGNLNMMMVNKNSEKLDRALGFLSFCAAPENYNYAFDGISTVSCFRNETANIQSHMVTDAEGSIDEYGRVSTAATWVIGYSADNVAADLNRLFRNETDVKGCVELMDEKRIALAKAQGTEGF